MQETNNALETKNIDFPTGECTILKTEDGLLEAWERKILIFSQENEGF